ncbi:MAG: PrsW family intramembrane metalloprotease [Rhodoglobus sp.]
MTTSDKKPAAGTDLPPDLTASAAVTNAPEPIPAPAAVETQTDQAGHPGLTQPVKRSSLTVILGVIGVIVLSVLALGVAVYLINGLGPDAFELGGLLALVPLTIVFFGARWIDRWEPEPRLAILFAFLWGAAVAVIIALVVGATVDAYVNANGGPGSSYDFVGAVIQAPIAEEGAKGLGLLVIFFVAKRFFDGPVDGVVYAAWVAGGFAFTENILYFGGQLLDAGQVDGSVAELFLIRGIMSPFAHVMFTSCTGLALGFAARRGVRGIGAIGFWIVGLVPAMLLHALWNGALFIVGDFYQYYFLLQFPLFLIAVTLVLLLRRQESRLTRDRLTEYAAAGWFNQDEVNSLATPAGRRQSRAWARQRGVGGVMKKYVQDATHLAFARQRIITGRNSIGAEADESALLESILKSRAALKAATPAQPVLPATGATTS